MEASRTVELAYSVNLPELKASLGQVDVWLPLPLSTPHQQVLSLGIECPADYTTRYDPVHGNWIFHTRIDAAQQDSAAVRYRATVRRREWKVDFKAPLSKPVAIDTRLMAVHLCENQRIRFLPEIVSAAAEMRSKFTSALDLAKAAYDHVLATMDYDKSGEGWGEGDTEWACSMGKGNCTDFHSLYLALLRCAGVPGRFEIGTAFPKGMTGGDITAFKCGYHCWVSFYTPEFGWVPADVSEAAQKADKRDYFFGAVDADRVLLSQGRDIVLEPAQAGGPENFFTEPCLESSSGAGVIYEKKLEFTDVI